MRIDSRLDSILKILGPALISGGLAWCTWTTKTLYEIKQDIAVLRGSIKKEVSLNAQISDNRSDSKNSPVIKN